MQIELPTSTTIKYDQSATKQERTHRTVTGTDFKYLATVQTRVHADNYCFIAMHRKVPANEWVQAFIASEQVEKIRHIAHHEYVIDHTPALPLHLASYNMIEKFVTKSIELVRGLPLPLKIAFLGKGQDKLDAPGVHTSKDTDNGTNPVEGASESDARKIVQLIPAEETAYHSIERAPVGIDRVQRAEVSLVDAISRRAASLLRTVALLAEAVHRAATLLNAFDPPRLVNGSSAALEDSITGKHAKRT
jgi:hypothetical protein